MPITIQLSKGYSTVIDDMDADLAEFDWRASTPKSKSLTYVYRPITISGKRSNIFLHRAILERLLDRPLEKHEVCDHRDGNSLNNRRSNLRVATIRQNAQNAKIQKNNKSGFKGVCRDIKCHNRWTARISVNGKYIHLGNFSSPEEAHDAYVEAAQKYFGEFANNGERK